MKMCDYTSILLQRTTSVVKIAPDQNATGLIISGIGVKKCDDLPSATEPCFHKIRLKDSVTAKKTRVQVVLT